MSFYNAFTAAAALPRTPTMARPRPKYGRYDDYDGVSPLGPPALGAYARGGPLGLPGNFGLSPDMVDPGGGAGGGGIPPIGPGPGGGPGTRSFSGDLQPEYTAANPMLDYLVNYWSNIAGTKGWQGAKGYWDSGFGAARPDLLEAYKALLARLGAPEGAWGVAPGG